MNVHEEFVDKFAQFMNENAEKYDTREEAIKAFSGVFHLSQAAAEVKESKAPVENGEKSTNTDLFEYISSQYVDLLIEEGLQTKADFQKVTKKEVLDIDGIGPATVKKLVNNGVEFK